MNAAAALEYITPTSGENNPPVADSGGPYTGITGTAVTFDGSASSDSDGSIVSYEWDFGDGNTSSDMNPENTYSAAGTYTITLMVADDENAVGTDTASVEITDTSSKNEIHISDVSVETSSRTAGKNTFVSAKSVVTILDNNGSPVEGATVSGFWKDATRDLDSAVTGSDVKVTVYSDEVKYKSGPLTFTFTVDGVSHSKVIVSHGTETPQREQKHIILESMK